MSLVLDASAAVHALVPSHLRQVVHDRLRSTDILAPTLIDTEVLSALARLERGEQLSVREADAALAAWREFPCTRLASLPLLPEIWSRRHSLRIADAHYVALAAALDVPLLTADARLARASIDGVAILLVR